MVRHGGCLGLGLAAMGSARQGRNFEMNESKFTSVETLICGHSGWERGVFYWSWPLLITRVSLVFWPPEV